MANLLDCDIVVTSWNATYAIIFIYRLISLIIAQSAGAVEYTDYCPVAG